MVERAVVVMTNVNVEVEEPRPRLAVAVPIEGCVGAETQRDQGRQDHQQRTEPPHATPEGQTQPSQHGGRLYSLQATWPESRLEQKINTDDD